MGVRGDVVCEVFVDFLSIFSVYFLDCSLFWIRSVRVVWGVQLSGGHVMFFFVHEFFTPMCLSAYYYLPASQYRELF